MEKIEGITLRVLRNQNKKTCTEVAQVLGVANSSVYNYEQGIRQINLEQVIILAKFYETTAEEIINAQLNSCRFYQLDNQRKHRKPRKVI